MSFIYMARAIKIKVGNPLKKLVLLKLADQANDDGDCWPSYQHIADQCEIGRSTVRKHVKELEEMGILVVKNRPGVLGNSSNMYRLFPEGVAPDSTPLCHQIAPPVLPRSTPPVAPDSTRTYHSSETIIEPMGGEPPKKTTRFIPPTVQQVEEYCRERKNKVSAEKFVSHYGSVNWYRGKTKISDWKACVRTWEQSTMNHTYGVADAITDFYI